MEEVYYSSGAAILLLCFVILVVLALNLGILRNDAKWARSSTLFDYVMGSATLFCMAIPLSAYIHRTSANIELRGLRSSLPYVGMTCYALLILFAAFLTLRNRTKLHRWIIFPVIAIGVTTWLVMCVSRDTNLKWGTVAYFVPQLLIFFAREQKLIPPANLQTVAAPPSMETSKS